MLNLSTTNLHELSDAPDSQSGWRAIINNLNYNDMATKAMIYVPECNVDVFKTDADSHGVEIELLEVDYFDNYIFDAEGDALNDNDWIEYLEANGIEVSVFSEILEEV